MQCIPVTSNNITNLTTMQEIKTEHTNLQSHMRLDALSRRSNCFQHCIVPFINTSLKIWLIILQSYCMSYMRYFSVAHFKIFFRSSHKFYTHKYNHTITAFTDWLQISNSYNENKSPHIQILFCKSKVSLSSSQLQIGRLTITPSMSEWM